MNKTCLIAGLPNTGKTTYIAALWYVIRHAKGGEALRASDELPNDVAYLNEITKCWLEYSSMDRSNVDIPNNIVLNLIKGDEELKLAIPDFKGETIRNIILDIPSTELSEWFGKSTNLLYFIYQAGHNTLFDQVGDEPKGNTTGENLPEFKVEHMCYDSLNMMILKYLKTHMNIENLVLCISAWDEKKSDDDTPESYLKREAPAFFHFLKYQFPDIKIYGISAQGAKYEYDDENKKLPKAEFVKKMKAKTAAGIRAYVNDDGKEDNDITLPLDKLL